MTATTSLFQAKAVYANSADNEEELSFEAGDVLTVIERDVAGLVGWWLCSHAGRIGIAPGNRLRLLCPTVESIVCNSSGHQQPDARKRDVSSAARPRPSTAPQQRRHTAQNVDNALVVPHKSGNVYVYDNGVQPCVDYDVPAARHTNYRTRTPAAAAATAVSDQLPSMQDYDVPTSASPVKPANSGGRVDDDIEFGVGDYDLLSPPPQQRPVSDVDCSVSSNRSSVTSVMSAGSLSSAGTGSVRSAQSPAGCVVGRSPASAIPLTYSYEPRSTEHSAAPRRCVSEATSDSSADSGIVLQPVLLSSPTSRLIVDSGASCRQNGATLDVDCLDYDVPVVSVNVEEGRPVDVVREDQTMSFQQNSRSSTTSHASPMINGEVQTRIEVDPARRRHVDELRDCVLRSVQRYIAWTGLVTGDTGRDAAATRQYHGQAKLAGLAVRTSLKELVAVVDEHRSSSSELLRSCTEPLSRSLSEIDRRLDSLIASGSGRHPTRLTASTCGQRAVHGSCEDQLVAVAEIVAGLPDHVKRFADFVVSNASVVIRQQDDIDISLPTAPLRVVSKVSPPPPPQRRDSHQRDRPPQSPSGVASSPRSRRPPLGKPPPVKPKPPKSVTWKRPALSTTETRPGWSRGPTSVNAAPTASRTNDSSYERRVAELNKTNTSATDGWNEDDCDYVSIVREVEREMESMARPVNKAATRVGPPADASSTSALNDDDRELLAFYAAQISSQAADVDAAAAEFYRCWSPLSSPAPSVDAFVRRSRFVVLAAHRLVYVGDVIARHVTDESVRDRVAAAANTLCDRLKAVVVATRHVALATGDSESLASTGDVEQTMMNCVRQATDDSRRLCDVISAIACQ